MLFHFDLFAERAAAAIIAVPVLYAVLVAVGRVLKRRAGVRFGFTYQLFAVALAFYLPLRIGGFNWRPGWFDLLRELGVLIAYCGVLAAIALLRRFLVELYLRDSRRIEVPKFLQDLVALLLLVAVTAIVLSVAYGQTIPGLLAGSGIAAIIIGLAMQDLLGNVIAGLCLQVNKPYRQGDWLTVDGQYGEVVEINWRSTRLRTNDHICLDIPNNHITKRVIVNLNYPQRLYATRVRIGLEYGAPPTLVKHVLKQAAVDSLALKHPEPKVFLVDFADSAVIYEVKFWMDDHNRFNDIADSVRTNIWYHLKRAGLNIPFPIRTLHHVRPREAATGLPELVRRRVLAMPLFACLGEENAARLLDRARPVRYGATETIIFQGQAGDSVFVVTHGTVRVEVQSEDGPKHLATLGVGECFGEMSLLTGESRAATVIAETDCDLIEIAKEEVAPLLEQHPSLAGALSDLLARRRLQMEEALAPDIDQANAESKRQRYAASFLEKLRSFFEL